MKRRVLIADDHRLFRLGVVSVIEASGRYEVVGEAERIEELSSLALATRPDILLLDLRFPGGNALRSLDELRTTLPNCRIIILTAAPDSHSVHQALQAGVMGYLLKDVSQQELLETLDRVAEGKASLCRTASDVMVNWVCGEVAGAPAPSSLAERERVLLRQVCQGRRNKEIADELGLNVKTLETVRSRLMDKLGVSTTAELVRYAIRNGMIEP
jgi:DNA-binding NarL/FixJ family response regulator